MPGGKSPKSYSQEFKDQAVRRVIDNSLTVGQVARELDVNATTLGCWVTAYRKKMAGQPIPAGMPESEKLLELERRNRELEMENAFLKKGVPRAQEAA